MDAAAGSYNRLTPLNSAGFHLLTDSDALFQFLIPPSSASLFHRLGGPRHALWTRVVELAGKHADACRGVF